MITSLTSSSLTADSLLDHSSWHSELYNLPRYKAIYLQLILNVYGAQVALAALAGMIGKPLIETTGWSTPELHEANFVQIMAAGNAVLNLATIFGMNMLASKVHDYSLSQNTVTFALGLPFNTVMGGLYGLAGAGMQHLLTDKEEMAFAVTAGATGTAIAYLSLAMATRMGSFTPSIPGIARYNFLAARTFIPTFLLGHNFSHSRYMALSASRNFGQAGNSEIIQLFIILYAANLMMSAAGGVIGYSILNANNWQNEFDASKFTEAMLIGSAIFTILTNSIMFVSSDLVSKNKISQNVLTYGIGIPMYAAMGTVYGLAGSAIQGSLKNPNAIEFTATAGAIGNALAYTASALLIDGRGALRRACTPAQETDQQNELLQKDNFFLKMYKRSCCVSKSKQTIELNSESRSPSPLQQRLLNT